jgi:allantoin racemase
MVDPDTTGLDRECGEPENRKDTCMTSILFLNPFGTDAYDDLIRRTFDPAIRADTRIDIRHLTGPLRNLDYFAAKHVLEVEIMAAAVQADDEGYDAMIIGCCYDPALTQCRELVDIPVVGPLEASVAFTRAFGHRYAVVTDHFKAVPELEDRIRLYGAQANCRTVTAIDWYVDDMVLDPARVAVDTDAILERVMRDSKAETVVIGCTIVSACYELAAADPATSLPPRSVISPNLMAVKMAEMLADLSRSGQYRINRSGYYSALASHDSQEAAALRKLLTGRGTLSPVAEVERCR